MVSENLMPTSYIGELRHLHRDGACWEGYLRKKKGFIKSDRAYRVPSSISGQPFAFLIYCEECCREKGWLW